MAAGVLYIKYDSIMQMFPDLYDWIYEWLSCQYIMMLCLRVAMEMDSQWTLF